MSPMEAAAKAVADRVTPFMDGMRQHSGFPGPGEEGWRWIAESVIAAWLDARLEELADENGWLTFPVKPEWPNDYSKVEPYTDGEWATEAHVKPAVIREALLGLSVGEGDKP